MFPLPSTIWLKIGAAAVVCVFMYFMGYNHEHKKFVKFQAEIAALGKAQESLNQAKVKEHETITSGIKDEYEARLAAIHNYYSQRVQQPNASPNRLPTVSKPAACPVSPVPDTELVERCARTTLQLTELQKWVKGVTNAK
jgi:hypothetical protein